MATEIAAILKEEDDILNGNMISGTASMAPALIKGRSWSASSPSVNDLGPATAPSRSPIA